MSEGALLKYDLLDHGYLRHVDHMGSDDSVIRNARVSYNGKVVNEDYKLINYLMCNRHNTPFESCEVQFEIKAPIFVVRQWHRHRTQCLSGDTKLKFKRPCDGKPYWKTLGEIVEQWFAPEPTVKRIDKQRRTRREFNRDTISNMELYCIEDNNRIATTNITDVMVSGVKDVFKITSVNGDEIKASKDHRFNTPEGWKTLEQLKVGDSILTISKIAKSDKQNKEVEFTEKELLNEEWRGVSERLEVSSLGRIRKAKTGEVFIPTINSSGRYVVSDKRLDGVWRTVQLSKLVANCFIKGTGSVIRHLNDNPLDNRISNLERGSDQDNHDGALLNGRRAFSGVTELEVSSIDYIGQEETYDIEVRHKDHNFIANNFCTHNSYNEVSARYTELPSEYYLPEEAQITTQHKDNKQMRTDEVNEEADIIRAAIFHQNEAAFEVYKMMLEKGCPREIARSVLPCGTYTRFFAKANLHNWFRFLKERLHPHAQYEIMVYAEAILKILEVFYPVSVKAFKQHENIE